MRKVIMYCDRCKKEFEKWNHKKTPLYGVAEFVYSDSDPYLDEPKDLCKSCYEELEKWWNFEPQEDVLDKVRAEITDTLYIDSLIFMKLINFRNGEISADDVIEEFNRVSRKEVLQIIDKYKAKSEEA